MLSQGQIQRMIDANADERLIRRVLSNGRVYDADALLAWLDRPAMHVVAMALAAQRLDELTYGPDPVIRRLGSVLVSIQCNDGLWAGDNDAAQAIATAAAVNALCRMRDRTVALGDHVDQSLGDAIQRGIGALRWLHDATNAFAIDETVGEIVDWLLEPSLHDSVTFAEPRAQSSPLFAHAA